MSKIRDLTGQKFALLTVINRAERDSGGKSYWNCQCDCGNMKVVSGTNLTCGAVKSCGCLKHKVHNTHHMSNTRLYRIWNALIQRCNNKNHFAYKYYGDKNITVCKEWMNDFIVFYDWAMSSGYSDELTIDRIDTKKSYCPENCRWVNRKVQANNRSFCKMIEYNGRTQTLMQWCEELKLNYKLIHSRLYRLNWTFEKAISTPVKRKE